MCAQHNNDTQRLGVVLSTSRLHRKAAVNSGGGMEAPEDASATTHSEATGTTVAAGGGGMEFISDADAPSSCSGTFRSGNRRGLPDDDQQSSSTASTIIPKRKRPIGTRRRQLEWMTNFVLVVVSLLGCSAGACLLLFYQVHLLTFISIEFFIVPLILSGGGLFTLLVSFIGLVATSRRSPCLLRFYAFCLVLAFTVLAGGVAASLKTIFTIHAGIDSSVTGSWMAMAKDYQEDDTTTATWDILHRTYRCCGAESTYELGYVVWQKNPVLMKNHAVPDSCCLNPNPGCGNGIFQEHDNRKMAEYVKLIHVHGCVRAVRAVLKEHVSPILLVFAISGSVLALVELLGGVLACSLANVIQESLADQKMESRRKRVSSEAVAAEAGFGDSASVRSLKRRRRSSSNYRVQGSRRASSMTPQPMQNSSNQQLTVLPAQIHGGHQPHYDSLAASRKNTLSVPNSSLIYHHSYSQALPNN